MEYYTLIFQEKRKAKIVSIKKYIQEKFNLNLELVRIKEKNKNSVDSRYIVINHLEYNYAKYFLSSFDDLQYFFWKTIEGNILIDTNSAESAVFIGSKMFFSDIISELKMEYLNG
jgi:hypothetical protein